MSASHSRPAASTSELSTFVKSNVERLITLRTSTVAACCSSASSCSRVRRATFVSLPVERERRPRPAFGALRRVNVLRRCVLAALPPALSRRRIASPEAQDKASYQLKVAHCKGGAPRGSHVRFGSKADMCSANEHVRFTPNSDRESGHRQTVRSALPPKADMCSAQAHVCFGPIADIVALIRTLRPLARLACWGW